MSFIVRNMKPSEMKIAVNWAAKEGWNPGLTDGEVFYNTDHEGFFVAELDGEIIGVKSAVNYNDEFGFMGFYIIKDEFRGKGYGLELWQHAFNRIKHICSGMDGVVEQQHNYMKSGYKLFYRQMRYEAKNIVGMEHSQVLNFEQKYFGKIVDYDEAVFPSRREKFLDLWLNQKYISAKIFIEDDKLKGYGVIRKCHKGFKIGPLFADDYKTAKALFLSLANYADGEEVYLDIPEVNSEANNLVKNFGMQYVFETARMYNNGSPKTGTEKVFGVTTFELG
ncbi:MAG TPA: GNAT family N-acetyltransferase [Ignavibacteriaceae bacterium]|nr:GNAT family N-acetyltransferase [Ignavibacteriaceae bacterium]